MVVNRFLSNQFPAQVRRFAWGIPIKLDITERIDKARGGAVYSIQATFGGDMKAKVIMTALSCGVLTACAASNAIKTSANTAIIQSSAAPVCGGIGAARVAQKQAAIETLKAGYDRYVIYDAAASNDVRTTQMPGRYQTTGTASVYGNMATINTSTQYIPGPTVVSGGHHQSLGVRMFKDGEPGAGNAISARETLGPKWQELVKAGTVRTCG